MTKCERTLPTDTLGMQAVLGFTSPLSLLSCSGPQLISAMQLFLPFVCVASHSLSL